MKISPALLCHAIRFAAIVLVILLVCALCGPNKPVQADIGSTDGHGDCRNASSGPGCAAACSLMDLEDCSDSTKDVLMVLCALVIVAAFALPLLFPGVLLGAAGLFTSLLESVWGVTLAAGGAASVLVTQSPTLEESLANLSEEAAAAVEVSSIEAQAFMQQISVVVANINQFGGGLNCQWCAEQVEAALTNLFAGGVPGGYAPPWFTPNMGFEEVTSAFSTWDIDSPLSLAGDMASRAGSSFYDTTTSDIVDQLGELGASGSGARGIVAVTDGVNAHVFNAFNLDGQVYFADGQSGEIWTDPGYLSGYGPQSTIRFLQTWVPGQ
jgi:hypothetical protein